MNKFMSLFFVMTIAVAVAEKYTNRYDSINIDEILENRTLLVSYMKCVLDKGRCAPEGKELKNNLSDAIVTGCTKCTDRQKKGSRKVVKHLKAKEQEYWNQLKAKYDPENKYEETYEAFLAAEN